MNKIQNLIDLIAAEEAQQAKLKKLIAQSERNVRVHNAALGRLRFPSQQVVSRGTEIKTITQQQPKEEWRLVGREDVGKLIKVGDTVKITGGSHYDGIYIVEYVDAGCETQPLKLSSTRGSITDSWLTLDEEAEIYLKVEK